MIEHRHVLGLSGGRDSAALAVYMRENYPKIQVEYFFTDTGKELPEVYEFLGKLEGFLGREIVRLNPNRDFDFWLKEYNNFLPSPQTRWCTRQLKIKPFEEWIAPTLEAGGEVTSYVAIRADEDRSGYKPTNPKVEVRFPFIEDGLGKTDIIQLLEESGLGMPNYYRWRSRSGCTFCFYQQKIEWVRLMREHPEAFEEAEKYEKTAIESGSPFTWSQGESLEELSQPERVSRIEAEYQKRRDRYMKQRRLNPLLDGLDAVQDIDELYGLDEVASSCIICHK